MLHKSIWLSNCITLIWTHAAAAEAVKPFKFFRNFLLSILHFFVCRQILIQFTVHCSLLCGMSFMCGRVVFVYFSVFVSFKWILKCWTVNRQILHFIWNKAIHSFDCILKSAWVCVCLTMCLPFLSLFLLKFLFAEQWVCVRECFLLLCIEYYWAHTTVTQYMYLK